jgi:hypothetical protein
MKKFRYTMFILTVFLALVFSAVSTVPVLADDAPPPTETTESETLPAEETTEESLEQDPVSDASQDESASETEEDASSVEQVISQLPEDTQLIVVNEEGETLPLVSQEAEDAIELGDPRWCPVGVTPGGAGCTAVFTSFQALLDHLATMNGGAGPSLAGVIWIEGTYNSSINDPLATEFEINGKNLTNMANYALTLNGGWSGNNNTSMNANTPSTFEVPLSIINWKNAVTIRNVVIQNATGADAALKVDTTGNITLINVDVRNNATENGGAVLSNDTGVGNVVVTNSNFIGNGQPDQGYGLQVLSAGTISLKNVSAIYNALTGAYLDNRNAVTPKAVTLTGYNFFSHNGGIGLDVRSKGAITLYNVTAIYNGASGAELNNCQPDFDTKTCVNIVASNVVLYGDNNFSFNGADGLRVYSSGTIITYNLTAYGNGTDPSRLPATSIGYDAFGKGVYLHNAFAATARPISIRGFNTINGNASTGLFAHSKGLVTVSNLTANDNQCDGSYDTNTTYCAGAYIDSRGVTVTGYGRFVNNDTEGLSVRSWGLVTLNNLYAESNPSHGVKIETYFPTSANTAVNVAVNGLNFFMDNGVDGLHVISNGVVTIRNATAMENGSNGIFVNNTSALAAPGVNLLGVNNTSYNSDNGVDISSKGVIRVNSLTAIANTYGAYLDNEMPGMLGGVTVSGTNLFVNNEINGLVVQSHGVVALYNVNASWNGNAISGGGGVRVDNSNGTAARAVFLYGINTFNNNYDDGLRVNSLGAITVYRITANNNGGFGAYLYNQHNKFHTAVTVAGYGFFNNNADTGLYIQSNGNVVTSNLTATHNNKGVEVHNHSITVNPTTTLAVVNVTMNGINNFSNNSGNGLTVKSDGAITLSKVNASGNLGSGAVLDNVEYGSTGARRNIVINGPSVFSGNGINGLQFLSSNVFSMTRFSADRNGTGGTGSGITGTAHSNITLSCGSINLNEQFGYNLTSTVGAITLRSVYAYLDTNASNKTPILVRACP